MKLEEPPHRRGDGRLSSTVPWERKGETPLREPIMRHAMTIVLNRNIWAFNQQFF
jgi:hypothetical protein